MLKTDDTMDESHLYNNVSAIDRHKENEYLELIARKRFVKQVKV